MLFSDHEKIKQRAVLDEGRFVILLLVMLAAIVTLGAIFYELSTVKGLTGSQRTGPVILTVITIATSWIFTHTLFALHYAHDFYGGIIKGHPKRLDFPGDEKKPDYGDFIYFSFTIGTTSQTSDVCVSTKHMRRLVIIHSLVSFFFNTAVLALTINIASSLI